jgi:hypothetical protein
MISAPEKNVELTLNFDEDATATAAANENDGQSNLFKPYAETMFQVDLLFGINSFSTSEVL